MNLDPTDQPRHLTGLRIGGLSAAVKRARLAVTSDQEELVVSGTLDDLRRLAAALWEVLAGLEHEMGVTVPLDVRGGGDDHLGFTPPATP